MVADQLTRLRTSGFGVRIGRLARRPGHHLGVDFAGPMYTPVYAPAAGVISVFGQRGNVVEIDHGHGLKTRFGHLAAIYRRSWAARRHRHEAGRHRLDRPLAPDLTSTTRSGLTDDCKTPNASWRPANMFSKQPNKTPDEHAGHDINPEHRERDEYRFRSQRLPQNAGVAEGGLAHRIRHDHRRRRQRRHASCTSTASSAATSPWPASPSARAARSKARSRPRPSRRAAASSARSPPSRSGSTPAATSTATSPTSS